MTHARKWTLVVYVIALLAGFGMATVNMAWAIIVLIDGPFEHAVAPDILTPMFAFPVALGLTGCWGTAASIMCRSQVGGMSGRSLVKGAGFSFLIGALASAIRLATLGLPLVKGTFGDLFLVAMIAFYAAYVGVAVMNLVGVSWCAWTIGKRVGK
jgi:hypothetical protein